MIKFSEVKIGQTFSEVTGEKFFKVDERRALSESFDLEAYYGWDEVTLVTQPEDMLYICKGTKVKELEG